MRWFILLLSMWFAGCGYRPMEEIAISPDCSIETQELIIEASEELFQTVPKLRVRVVISEDNGKGFIQPTMPRGAEGNCESGALAVTRLTPTKAPVIGPCPDRELSREDWKVVYMHELGHALTGTDDHIEEAGHIMTPKLEDTSATPTALDASFLRERLQ